MGRTFAQINCSLLNSRKLSGLNHAERWVYLCAHLTPFSHYTAVFNYPAVLWVQDANVTEGELDNAQNRLCEVGLIEWDEGEELVRLIGFHRQRPPENASRSISLINDFERMLSNQNSGCQLVVRTAAEFAVAAIERSRRWNSDGTEIEKLRKALGPFLRAAHQEQEDAFLLAVRAEVETANKATRGEIGSLLPAIDTVPTPCPHPGRTRDVDETRRKQDKDENETVRNSPFEVTQSIDEIQTVDLQRKGTHPKPSEATKRSRLVAGD